MVEMRAHRVMSIARKGIAFIYSERERRVAELRANKPVGFWEKFWHCKEAHKNEIRLAEIWANGVYSKLESIRNAAQLALAENGEMAMVELTREDAEIIFKYR